MTNENLKALIARRKTLDWVFATVGVLSVLVGLATLSALMVKLAMDARHRAFVPRGTVALAKGPLSPDDQAWEMRKLSGDALRVLLTDDKLRSTLLDVGQMIDIPRLKREAQAGTLQKLIEENRWGEVLRADNVRQLISEKRTGRLVNPDRFVPESRVRELQEDPRTGELLDLEAIGTMSPGDGLKVMFNRLNLVANAKVPEGAGRSILQRWIADGDFENNLPRILNQRRIGSLIAEDRLGSFVERELVLARQRPKELNTAFFTTLRSSASPETAGILTAWVGSLCVIAVCMLAAVPVGVAAGIYLEEYAPKNRLTGLIEINIANLAGVPSIIYGLMALGLFVYLLHLGRSILTAGLTLGLLALPIVIMATREAIRAIPQNIREASYACGSTKWQTVRYHVLPYSSGGILTGSIIALSRAIGETAPILTIALVFVTNTPASSFGEYLSLKWLWSDFTALPLVMFNWTSQPEAEFRYNAALAGLVLIVMTLSLNATAIYLRYRLRKSIKW